MPLYAWIALLFVVAATALGALHVFRHARALWRTFKAFGGAVDETVRGVEASVERLTASSAGLGSGLPRLEAHTARLRTDLARFAVLRAALQDVRDSFGRILAVYPRK